MNTYIIWSNEHQAWWRPDSHGYTRWVEDAGNYTLEEATAICKSGYMDTPSGRRKCEVMFLRPDVIDE